MTFIQRILLPARGGALLLVTVAFALVMGPGAGGAYAGLITDAGFDNAFQVTGNLSASSNNDNPYGLWWTASGLYTQIATGGNPDAWAQKTNTTQAARAKALVHAIEDLKTTTGTATLNFDVHVDSVTNSGQYEVRATVYGIPDASDWGTGDFLMSGGLNSTLTNLPIPSNATSLATVNVKDDVTLEGGWESFSLGVPLGAGGYDVLVVYMGIRGTMTVDNAGFDNVQLAPEPATLVLVAMGGLGVLARRRRR